jgi:hypothetical protein
MKITPKFQQKLDKISAILGHAPNKTPSWADLAQKHTPTHWDWPGWLPRGYLTILAGQPGLGKSSLCLHLAASYIDGRPIKKHLPCHACTQYQAVITALPAGKVTNRPETNCYSR